MGRFTQARRRRAVSSEPFGISREVVNGGSGALQYLTKNVNPIRSFGVQLHVRPDSSFDVPDSVDSPSPGTLIGGKYRIVRTIGEGGMGVVVEAHHVQLDQRVAIKFLRGTQARDERNVARFRREARAAAKVKSDHVAQIHDVGTLSDGTRYLVMEYLDGWDLGEELEKQGRLEIGPSCSIALQVLDAIGRAHEVGIVHRDLKPENLFLVRQTDGTRRVKVVDFGISKLDDTKGSLKLTVTSDLMGTPLYMSPEQMATPEAVDGRSDLWSVGCVLYEMLTGRLPFFGRSIPEICTLVMGHSPEHVSDVAPEVPRELGDIVMKCLARDPDDRHSSAGELSVLLESFLVGSSGPSRSWVPGRVTGISRVVSSPVPSVAPITRSIPFPAASVPFIDAPSGVSGVTASGGSTTVDLTETRREGPHRSRRRKVPWVAVALSLLVVGFVVFVNWGRLHPTSSDRRVSSEDETGATQGVSENEIRDVPTSEAAPVTEPLPAEMDPPAAPEIASTAGTRTPPQTQLQRPKPQARPLVTPRPPPKPAVETTGGSRSSFRGSSKERSVAAPDDEFAEFGGRR